MSEATVLEREEYVEQAYFFRTLRERTAQNMATQEVLDRLHEEILATTRLPYAVQFLATEVKHTGLLSSGLARLGHYFTKFQAFIIESTENDQQRFNIETALLVLEREAEYRAARITPSGLFVYQLEVLSRNRLGYDSGLTSMAADPLYDDPWREYLDLVRRQLGLIEIADLIYVRSAAYVRDQRRSDPDYQPPVPVLFEEKEGRIAKASRGRDPLYLFAALQRQLGYPIVPRPRPRDDTGLKIEVIQARLREMEKRVKLLEQEVKGNVDLSEFGKPEILKDEGEE